MTHTATPAELKAMLHDGQELALLDVREYGRFGAGHLLFACPTPFSRLEFRVADLVPRRSARVVLCDEADGLAERAAQRLAGQADRDPAAPAVRVVRPTRTPGPARRPVR